MSATLTDSDRRLLVAVQRAVPLVPRPYHQLADELGAAPEEVITRIAALGAPGGILREICGIFDAAALGHASTLVAARCRPDRLDQAGKTVSAHPGVSHCYRREGELNLWFTLCVPPDSRLGLKRSVELLGRRIGAERVLSLPALRRYKLDARFDLTGETAPAGRTADRPAPGPARLSDAGPAAGVLPTAEQMRAIGALQSPLPAMSEPFAELARVQRMGADDLLVHASDFVAGGWMRRYAAVVRHRQAGATVNVLVAWRVPQEKADAFGAQAARFAAVSHCYLRSAAADWPHTLYTMIHGRDVGGVDGTVAAIAAAGGDFPRVCLPTVCEYKKTKVRLFSPEFARWEANAQL